MISVQPGLYVRIEQLEGERAPQPLPLSSGFTRESAYLVLGMFTASETSEAYLILVNESDEIWFISNRHVRTCGLRPNSQELRLPLSGFSGPQGRNESGAHPEQERHAIVS